MTTMQIMPIRTTRTLLTRKEASERLGVSERRIGALCASGDLTSFPVDGASLVTEDSVRRQMLWQGKGGRPYSSSMAFAALYALSGLETPWIDRQQRYRLGKYLRETDVQSLMGRVRRRAVMREFWCRDSLMGKVREQVRASAATGDLATGFQLMPTGMLEGYITSDKLDDVVRRCRLRQGDAPTKVRLRIADDLPEGMGSMPLGVCAADLAESSDPRERRAGLETLSRLIDEHRCKEDYA